MNSALNIVQPRYWSIRQLAYCIWTLKRTGQNVAWCGQLSALYDLSTTLLVQRNMKIMIVRRVPTRAIDLLALRMSLSHVRVTAKSGSTNACKWHHVLLSRRVQEQSVPVWRKLEEVRNWWEACPVGPRPHHGEMWPLPWFNVLPFEPERKGTRQAFMKVCSKELNVRQHPGLCV